MTDPIPLPALLSAMAQEARALVSDWQMVERSLLPVLLPAVARQPEIGPALQRFDPLLQRLSALSRIADAAATEAPDQPMPAATACLRAERLAALLPDLRPPTIATSPTGAPMLFDPPA